MKKIIIVALVCINVALVAVLAFGVGEPKATAQVRGGGSDYMAITARWGTNDDVVYVVDLGSRRMAAWSFNQTNKRLDGFFGRDLQRDFRPTR